ncbi:MAG: phytanoyl-CoA dioxygenase family protein [Gallionella sp.]|jgi:ectoine hydroxylase-related dioxygenase (phytanoyl-CoA dioxygenase family)
MTFAHQGYAVINEMLSEPDLLLARELVAHLIERHREGDPAVVTESVSVAALTRQHPQRNPGIDSRQVEDEPFIIGNLVSLDSRFARLFSINALWSTAARLLVCAQEEVVFHFSNVTRKPPLKGPAIGWHRDADNTYFASADQRTLRLLLPLQQMSVNNGGTKIVAASHLPGATQTADDENFICDPTVAPRSCLVLHSKVLHGGSPNRSTAERDVIVIQFGVITSELRHRANELLSLSDRESFMNYVGNNTPQTSR